MNITLSLAKNIFYICKLRQLILEGKDESDEAEAVRNKLELDWFKMSNEEIKFAQQISARLKEAFPGEK